MAHNKTVAELKELARSLTNQDLQILVALYGLTVAQDVAIEMFEDQHYSDLMGDSYPGEALVAEVVDFVDSLISREEVSNAIAEFNLAKQFGISIDVKVVATAV